MRDFYEILGVSEKSEIEVITAAYKAMMRKYHPDTNKASTASDKAKQINEAYDALKDPSRRREYDAKRRQSNQQKWASSPPSSPPPPPPPPPASPPPPPPPRSQPNSGGAYPEVDASLRTIFFEAYGVETHGVLRIWVIYACSFLACLLLYFITADWKKDDAPIGTLLLLITILACPPFFAGFLAAKFWSSVEGIHDVKALRMRWLFLQIIFAAVGLIYISATQRAAEAPSSIAPPKASETVEVDNAERCYKKFDAKDWTDAWQHCFAAAKKGDAASTLFVGDMFDYGKGVAENDALAVLWYRKASKLGATYADERISELEKTAATDRGSSEGGDKSVSDVVVDEYALEAEYFENLRKCLDGKAPSLCDHSNLTEAEAADVLAAEKRENLRTCLDGKYPSLCNHSILSSSEAAAVLAAKK